MQKVRVEFTVEPFREGGPGRHVEAALESLRNEGYEPEVGPFGNAAEGEATGVLEALAHAAAAAFAAGASGITMSARAGSDAEGAEAFLAALRPVARALGGRVVMPERMQGSSVPLVWKGQVVGGFERPAKSDLRNGLAAFVSEIEEDLGASLSTLGRAEKQRAVRMLDERGAFAIRNAVDEVADAMGVSRVTVYNYLNATRSGPEA